MVQMIVSVDPGINGALSFNRIGHIKTMPAIVDMPTVMRTVNGNARRVIDLAQLYRLVKPSPQGPFEIPIMVIEDVHGMPGQSGPASFTFGRGVGWLEGLAYPHYRIEYVHAARWKSALGLSADKDEARARAAAEWPNLAHMFARKRDDGRAEAALIGLYAQQVYG